MTIPDAISRVELEEVIEEFTSRLYTVEGRLNLRIDRLEERMDELEKKVDDGFSRIQDQFRIADENFTNFAKVSNDNFKKVLDSIEDYARRHNMVHGA